MDKIYDVAIIGGGVSGAVIASQLAHYDISNVLFEQENSIVNGPPFCHLHAGGNLYPDISDEQCKTLMKQSIDMARLFPQSIDKRPTFISIPKSEKYKVETIENRLKMLVDYYKKLISEDSSNEIIGSPEDYYNIYTEKDLAALKKHPIVKCPSSPNEWMCNATKLIDYNKLKMPLILVQEYGWNLFRLGAQVQLALKKTDKCNLKLNTKVINIKDVQKDNSNYNWEIYTNDKLHKAKYLVNACGFKTGVIDKTLHLNTTRLIEFKAAYISQWHPISGLIPELIFHGERGTDHGMAQLTPYSDDYYQIHGMTKNITLFENGVIQSTKQQAQPEFNEDIKQKLSRNWEKKELNNRTNNAIEYIAQFVPTFKSSKIGGPPLFGAQQVVGEDLSLRVGEVSFPYKFYARSEIIKASSALTVANQIIDKIQEEKIINPIQENLNRNRLLESITKNEIDNLASEFAIQRGYPKELSQLMIERE